MGAWEEEEEEEEEGWGLARQQSTFLALSKSWDKCHWPCPGEMMVHDF